MSRPVSDSDSDTHVSELQELLQRVHRGDQQALAELYENTITRVYTLALRILRNPADAEEVCTDVYRQVWDQAERYNPDRGTVIAWVMIITRSRALDHLRKRNTAQAGRQHPDDPMLAYMQEQPAQIEDLLEIIESDNRVHRALKQLSRPQRQAITLGFLEGLSHPEIAERLATPLGTVKSNIRRGLARLRQILSDSDTGNGQ